MEEVRQGGNVGGVSPHLRALVAALRPRQWTKNLLVYVAFFFTLNQRWDLQHPGEAVVLLGQVTAAFLLFCALSGATYLVNDLTDLERDRLHPRKRSRPLASGALPVPLAVGGAVVLGVGGLVGSFVLDLELGLVALTYLALQGLYSAILKNLVILDVLAISAGFLLRAVAGAVVLEVPISPWLYIGTTLGALFIGFGKRRNELALLGEGNPQTRASLSLYSLPLLDQLIAVVAPTALIAYTLYTFTAEALPPNRTMMLTIPFVAYGLFRYLYLIYHRNLGESPEEVLLTDKPLLANILLWLVTAVAVLLAFRG